MFSGWLKHFFTHDREALKRKEVEDRGYCDTAGVLLHLKIGRGMEDPAAYTLPIPEAFEGDLDYEEGQRRAVADFRSLLSGTVDIIFDPKMQASFLRVR